MPNNRQNITEKMQSPAANSISDIFHNKKKDKFGIL